ncbi:MAG: hypothetical protein GTN37_03185 [Candidatus Aenigmarchaeota archaeon]|nr:hypothetical protein [Candidatus Aenigmarchaeota archaeon]NIQ18503.1 hypothetical protein [Candidatus Aenigmarchaeota archaeon]NIS73402.1 hypothetical protein [Candidatus Aenigmarchaeota archaeon]
MSDLLHTFRFKPRPSAIPLLREKVGENLINFEWVRAAHECYNYKFFYKPNNKTIRVEVHYGTSAPATESRRNLRIAAAETLEEEGYI